MNVHRQRLVRALLALGALLFSATLLGSVPASATSQERARFDALSSKLRGSKPTAGALGPILELVTFADTVPAKVRTARLAAVAKLWRRPGLRPTATSIALDLALQKAALDSGDAKWTTLPGAVTAWSWLGPLPSGAGTAFSRFSDRDTSVARRNNVAGRDGPVSWRPVPAHWRGHARFAEVVERPADAIVYAESWVRLRAATEVDIVAVTTGQARVAVDGKIIGTVAKRSAGDRPDATLPSFTWSRVGLSVGWHVIRVKLSDSDGALGLQVLLAPANRRALVENTAQPPPSSTGQVTKATRVAWFEPLIALARKGDGAALSALAAMSRHGWSEAASDAVQKVLAEAKSLDARLAWALWAAAPGDRATRLATVKTTPGSWSATDALLARSRAMVELERAADVHRRWQALAASSGDPAARSVRACAQRVDLWLQLGADTAAWLQARRCAKKWPRAPRALAVLSRVAQARDHLALAVAIERRLMALHPGSARHFLQWLIVSTTVSAPRGAALDALVNQAMTRPDRRRGVEILARTLTAQARLPLARTLLARLPTWQWRSTTWALSSRIAARQGDRKRAVSDLRHAMRAAPGRTDYRERLRLLVPAARFYQPYRRDLIARARRSTKPAVPLQTAFIQTVLRHDGARQARYEAEVLVIGAGGPSEHEVEIDYVPSQSQVEVLTAAVVTAKGQVRRHAQRSLDRVSEDWYGLYYDLERITLRFSGLTPGDRIVVEHVVRDYAADPFAMVFGELLRLADTRPIREQHLALEIAAGTPLHHVTWDAGRGRAAPASLRKTGTRKDRDRTFDVWQLDLGALPAVAVEANMPGVSEIAHYLHMSSFSTWAAVSRWYGGLVRQALASAKTDPAVKQLALRLGRGAESDDEKIRRVFHHVAHKIRYVGLEFGVHSLRPHDVSLVLARQFGDCKDKATLIVALLGHLGIDAEVALVRTADNGLLADPVASLGVFDHAIAWVPSRKLWLDATQQHHAVGELPALDAGGMALRIPLHNRGSKPTLVKLPRAPGAANRRDQRTTWVLQADGAATGATTVDLTGLPAVDMRTLLRDPATRKESLQERLSRRWPGADVEAITALTGASPPEPTTRVAYRTRVPSWAQRAGAELTATPFAPDEALVGRITGQASRQHDYILSEAFDEQRRLVLVAPPGFKLHPPPPAATIDRSFARFELTFDAAGDRVTAKVRVHVKQARIPAEDHARWRAFVAEVDRLLRVRLRWTRTGGKP